MCLNAHYGVQLTITPEVMTIMATKLRAPAKKKQPAATATSLSIEDQVKTFLEGGGEIEQVKSGVSGQESMLGRKQINLNSKPKDS